MNRSSGISARRLLDICLALLLMMAGSPLFAIAAIGIRLSSPGPILYRATRVGLDGRPFTMHKFRSMTVRPAGSGPVITRPDDVRVFPFGAFLRSTKIDELPQLWDVLRGKMAMVGPRPEDPHIVARYYTERQRKTLSVLPGLTSPGALFDYTHGPKYLAGADVERTYAEQLLPVMLEIELIYVENRSLTYDLWVILRTATTVLRHLAGQRHFPDPPELRQIHRLRRLPADVDAARSP